jgi:hypothetical protein
MSAGPALSLASLGDKTMELLEVYKRYPHTNDEVRIYEFTGRTKKLIDKPWPSGNPRKELKVGKVYSLFVAATTLEDALLHLKNHRPEFQPNHAHCCGVMYLHHRYPFGQEIPTRTTPNRCR